MATNPRRKAVSNEDLAGQLAVLEEQNQRLERKLDALLKALSDDEEDEEDNRRADAALERQGDRPLIPHDEAWRRIRAARQ